MLVTPSLEGRKVVVQTKETISRCSWEDNIKINVKEIGFENVHWIHSST
jgi:hypothetical protein